VGLDSQKNVIPVSSDTNGSLNFYPYYESLLKQKLKTKTIRLGDQTSKYHKGSIIKLTCGWNPQEAVLLGDVRIVEVLSEPIGALKDEQLDGESPDCQTVAAVPFVLSAIYRKVVTESDIVTVIRWTYVD
jgi:hypothetical protein